MYVILNIHHDTDKEYCYPDKEHLEQSLSYMTFIWEQLQSKVRELLTWMLRIWRNNGFDTDCYFSSLTKENTIYTITEYIDRHACENIRVEDIAALCHMSYSHFAKNFREIYGQSCKKYIEFIRLCKVEDMLLFTNFDLNYISQETGYADCSHLIRSLKEKYGVSPHQYRRQHSSPRQNH